jgi:hypothetical protein
LQKFLPSPSPSFPLLFSSLLSFLLCSFSFLSSSLFILLSFVLPLTNLSSYHLLSAQKSSRIGGGGNEENKERKEKNRGRGYEEENFRRKAAKEVRRREEEKEKKERRRKIG